MKNYKRFATMAMATVMVAGNIFTSIAATEATATGTGDYEGYVEKTSVFTVDVPTAAANQFDFFVDPNQLLSTTNYARISGATANDFETDTSLFFTRTPGSNVKKYGKDSEAITLTNKSSYAVNVEVLASVSGADGIKIGTIDNNTTEPTIQLAIVSGSESEPIGLNGGKLEGTIEGEDNNFEIKWNSSEQKYEYGLIANPVEANWKKYSFNLTGACGGTWTAEQAEIAPVVTLKWKVTDPKAIPATSSVPATVTLPASGAIEVPVTIGTNGDELTKLETSEFAGDMLASGGGYGATYADGKITIGADMAAYLMGADASALSGITFTATFGEGEDAYSQTFKFTK